MQPSLENEPFIGQIEKSLIKKMIIKSALIPLLIGTLIGSIVNIVTTIENEEFSVGMLIGTIVIVLSIVLFVAIIVGIYMGFFVRKFQYEVSEQYIVIRHGVFEQRKTTIPYSRIQNVSIGQGPLDRRYKTYTVKIETAGTSGAANNNGAIRPEGFIPAVKDPTRLENLINRLVNQYTQQAPENVRGFVFEDNNVAFDEFISYILHKIQEGEDIQTRIKDLRKTKNMTQSELADAVGVSRQTISYLEKGSYSPSLNLAFKIAKVFGVSIEEIFQFDENTE